MKEGGWSVRAKVVDFFRATGVRVAISRETISRMLGIAYPTLDAILEKLVLSGHLEKLPFLDQYRPTRGFEFGDVTARKAAEREQRKALAEAEAAKDREERASRKAERQADKLALAEKNAAIREAAKAAYAKRAAEIAEIAAGKRKAEVAYASDAQLRARAKRDARLAEAARKRAIKDAKIAARAEEAEAKKLRAAEWAAKRAAEIAARPVRVGARGPKSLSTEPNAFVKAKRAELARLAASAPLVIFRGTPKPSAPYVDPWKIIRARIAAKPPLLPSEFKPDLVKAMRRRA